MPRKTHRCPKDSSTSILGIKTDIGKEQADTFRSDLNPDIRDDYVLITVERDSVFSKAKPNCWS